MFAQKTKLIFSFLIILAFSNSVYSSTPKFKASETGFKNWLSGFKKQAVSEGISKHTLDRAFKGVTLNKKVIESDRKQPEFTQTFFQYFNRAVSKHRINNGKKFYKKHKTLLDKVTQKYGVPGRYLIAFWGMETNYGGYTGKLPIIQSLATLAYDPRRSEFFTNELLSALTILDSGHISLEQMNGSWAGAMGHVQFMPSNYLRYGVDGDGDGKVNLWDSLPDALYSAGNFLQQLGWKNGENWGREVKLPNNFDYSLADNRTKKPLNEWHKLGIKFATGKPIPNIDLKARLLLIADYKGPAFLVYDNFKVIKRWNNADKYAIAVGHLSDRIISRPALSKKSPINDKGMSTTQVKEIQSILNSLGYQTGKPDGIAGSKTKKALRDFQIKHKLPADGFPSLEMLKALRKQTAKKSGV